MEDAVNILEKFWPLLILIAFFYFSMYRPQKKLRLERKRFLLSLRKGNHVVTSSGIYGGRGCQKDRLRWNQRRHCLQGVKAQSGYIV